MPEGVEVKISVDLIKPFIKGRLVTGIEIYPTGRYIKHPLVGLTDFQNHISTGNISIIDVASKGKFMYWEFTNFHYMMCTFGMTGQWSPFKGKHPCLAIKYLNDNKETSVYFNDARHFGTIKFVNTFARLNAKRAELGWDPLSDEMNEPWMNYVFNECKKTNKCIGELLLNQRVFAGVGNYIRAEALYLAKISPWRIANVISKEQMHTLCQALVDVMSESYKHRGATIRTYKDAFGESGEYAGHFKVYGRQTDPLGNPILRKLTPDKRTMHWCPAVQL